MRGHGATAAALLAATALLAAAPGPGAARDDAPASNPCNPCGGANPCNPCGGANPCNPCGGSNPCNPCGGAVPSYPSEIEGLIQEFMATSRAVADRPGGDDAVEFPGSAQQPNWFQALVVTRAENPFLEEECKKEAMQLSVESLRVAQALPDEQQAVRAAAAHIQGHVDFVKSHGISYSGYLREIAECRAFCAPLVANLMRCQVLSVARSVHGIVLFELGSDRVDPRYDAGVIANVSTQLRKDGQSKVVLIGRASPIGDLKYNRRLSARRALAVRDRLIARGVPGDRVETMWLGWEPPQISAWVADEYGMRDLFQSEGARQINQSVVLAIY